MYICVSVNINESVRPPVLMVTQAECDMLIDLGGVEFPVLLKFSCKVRPSMRLVFFFSSSSFYWVTANCGIWFACAHSLRMHVSRMISKQFM